MTGAERDAIYQRMRERRLRPVGIPLLDQDLIDHDVIASSRLAGVDVMPWIGSPCSTRPV